MFLSETLFILGINERDMLKNVCLYSFLITLAKFEFSGHSFDKIQVSNFMKNRSSGGVGAQTD